MAIECPAPNPNAPLFQNLAEYLDCHAQGLGENGFKALAGGLIVPALLASCLTIYIAILGYRLLLGERLGVRDIVLVAIRIGLVVTFCTSWTSFETVIYRVVTDGPAEVASAILQPSGLAAFTMTDTTRRLQYDYDAIQKQASSSHPQDQATPPSILASGPGAPVGSVAGGDLAQHPADGASAIFLLSSMGGLMIVRLAAGFLLALGPLVIAVALFDGMLGFFEGWVRALAGVALGSVGASVVMALELAFIDAELAIADAAGANGLSAQNISIVAWLFTLLTIGVLIASAVVARGFKLPIWRGFHPIGSRSAQPDQGQRGAAKPRVSIDGRQEAPVRAQAVADAITSQGQRERVRLGLNAMALAARFGSSSPATTGQNGGGGDRSQPLGLSLRRPPASRRSASVSRRDSRR
jgi:type IV secretion system protein VirB6